MSGGDKTAPHHCIRNRLYIHAEGAKAVPVLEAADVLNVLEKPGQEGDGGAGSVARSWERPADVLLCSNFGLQAVSCVRRSEILMNSGSAAYAVRIAWEVSLSCLESKAASIFPAVAGAAALISGPRRARIETQTGKC